MDANVITIDQRLSQQHSLNTVRKTDDIETNEGCANKPRKTFSEMVNEADQRLFHNMRYNSHHVLHELLPPISVASQNYELRTRAHNREIPCRAGSLSDSNFITRMMYTDCY